MKATNNFAVTGFVAVSNPRTLGKASVCHFALSVGRLEGTGKEKRRVSSLLNIETWCKNEKADETFAILKKGNLITVEGFLKPHEWVDKKGEKHNTTVLAATKVYLANNN